MTEKALAATRSPRTLHDFGVASAINGELDRGIALLEQAADQPTSDARMESDLAAVYLARGTRDGNRQDFEKALSATDRAVMSQPELPEALFNRALALERLSLRPEARAAWLDYLQVDGQSAWAAEARSHLADRGDGHVEG
jgi:Flp pilus assembly protein TadD